MLAIGDSILRSINFVFIVIALGLTCSLAANTISHSNSQVNFAAFASAFGLLTSSIYGVLAYFSPSWPGLFFWPGLTSWTWSLPFQPLLLWPSPSESTLVVTKSMLTITPLPKVVPTDVERPRLRLLSCSSRSLSSWLPPSSPWLVCAEVVCLEEKRLPLVLKLNRAMRG